MIVFILLLVRAGYPYNLYCDNSDQVTHDQWCDGSYDCADRSDEKSLCCVAGKHRVDGECEDIDECSRAGSLVCSQHCHNTDGSFGCSCDPGFSLNQKPHIPDERETYCKALGDDPVFLTSIDNKIMRTSDLQSFDLVSMVGVEDSHHIYDFDYDYQSNLLFWCSGDTQDLQSAMHKNLWKASYDNSQLIEAAKIADGIDCVSIAVDWINKKVYWVTANSGQLVASNYDGTNQATLLWRNVGWNLRAVAVSPKSGYIFWSNCGADPHIGRANMDGSHPTFLIKESEGDQIMEPTAMTVDQNTNHLYWIDAHYRTLHIMDFNGNDFSLQRSNIHMISAWRMSLFEDSVYWVDSVMSEGAYRMHHASKLTGDDYYDTSLEIEAQISGFRMYHQLLQPAHSNACTGNKCQHLCLLTPTGYACQCNNGYLLIDDERSCRKLDSPCTANSCDPRYCIMCGTGDCILSKLKCDGDIDCYDGTDEQNCPYGFQEIFTPMSLATTTDHHSNCMAREFQCLSGRCISEKMKCDGTVDCDDSSDEDPRFCVVNNQCNREDFLCDGTKCLSLEKRCDGTRDCLDGTDELNCDGPQCSDSQFTCSQSRQCIDGSRRCDRNNDCPDGSDEFSCPLVCRETEFSCDNEQHCVLLSSKCDGAADCRDGSDERDCAKTPLCPEGQRKCSPTHGDDDVCRPESDFCNNVDDCPGGTDEIGCDCQKEPDMIPCPGSRDCIRKDQWCDRTPDCDNSADEREGCCPHGFHRPNQNLLEECVDENECDRQDGVCSQHCANTEGGFTCSCDEGYDLVDTTKQNGVFSSLSYCRARGDMNIVITVRADSLYHLNVPSGSGEAFDSDTARSSGNFKSVTMSGEYEKSKLLMADFDFDIRNKKLFWCSTKHYADSTYERAIWVADLGDNLETLKNSKMIVNNINCDSMAVDWINKLVYFTSDTNSIEVVDYEGQNRRALIWTGLSAPRAIELDPEAGLLFYTDWGQTTAHLGRSNMDGADRRSLINNTSTNDPQIKWPNALTIDHPNKNLYWMDAGVKSIECMRYDGSARYTISNKDSALGFPWRMRVFQDRVYWRERDGEVKSANKFTGNQFVTERVVSALGEKLAVGMGLRIYHPVIQPESTPRCRPDLCQKLCLPIPNGYQCACPTGHSLLPDNFNCAYKMENFAFVATKEMIVKTALEPLEPVLQPIMFKENKYMEGTFWSVDFHENWVYYNTISENISQISIRRMLFDGSDSKILYKVVVNEKSDGGLSIDWLNEKIYWSSFETVSVGELDGSVHTTLLQKEGFDFRDILVDPCNGYIYLAALGRGIYRCSMDGDISSFVEIVRLGEDSMPSGLTLDRDIGALFFANMNSIYKLKLKLKLRDSPPVPEPIINRPERVNINSLDVWGRDWIIWTENYNISATDYKYEKRDRLVAREKIVHKNGDEEPPVQIIREDIKKDTFGIKVSPKRDSGCSNHLAANPCSENQCSHMCLQSQVEGLEMHPDNQKKYRCVCPTGYALKENSTTQCADEIAQYLVYNPDSGIQTVSLDTNFLTPIKGPPNMSFKVTTFDIDAKNNLVYYCYGYPNKYEVRGLFDETGNVTSLPIYTSRCSGMSVEWVTNKLYIVDTTGGLILVVNLDKPYLTKSIVHALNNPLDIVVHPRKGKIYWILESHSIMSTNMDGTDLIETIVSVNKGPEDQTLTLDDSTTQMFIDFTTDHLYWTENVHKRGTGFIGLIKRVDLNTKQVETVLEMLQEPLAGATMINNNIYFTDLAEGRLYRKDGAANGTFLLTTSSESFLLSSQSQPQLLENPCERIMEAVLISVS
ncbi:low-density lipoprotein receptor-related protein 2-like isoform X1 [Bolinopsis microptera]|uniref:low-density lipoprotein receptor-related protein 2-like isoform X1 n=1 Tax=Bolinopsis microptera TaxID=2820187 RepID=UPI00307A4EDB